MYKEPGAYTNVEKKDLEEEIRYVVAIDNTAPATSKNKVWSINKIDAEFAKQNEVKKVSSDLENVKQNISSYFLNLHIGDKSKAQENSDIIQNIQKAINGKGGILYLPSGIIYTKKFTIDDNITLVGAGESKTIIQLEMKTERYYSAILVKNNCIIKNLSIKDDKENNQIPSTVGTEHADNPQSILDIIGINFIIENCGLYNSSTWSIYLDDSGNVDNIKDNIIIKNCYFEWDKRSYYKEPFDVSQIYITCNKINIVGNTFITKSPKFSRTALDIRGFNILVERNKILEYIQPLLLGNATFNPKDGTEKQQHIVRDNYFTDCKIGTMIYSYSKGFNDIILNHHYNNLLFENNKIVLKVKFNDFTWETASSLISGFTISPLEVGIFENIKIKSNYITFNGEIDHVVANGLLTGIGIYNSKEHKISEVVIEGNTIEKMPHMAIAIGHSSGTNENSGTKNISITNNILIDNGKQDIKYDYLYFYSTNIYIADKFVKNVTIKNNKIYSTDNLNSVCWLSTAEYRLETKNIFIGENEVVGNKMGTNLLRDSNLGGNKNGEPFFYNVDNYFNLENLNAFVNVNSNINCYNFFPKDLVIKSDGIYMATNFGTIAPTIDNITVTKVVGTNCFEVNSTNGLFANMNILCNVLQTRIMGIVESKIFIQYQATSPELVGKTFSYPSGELVKLTN